MVERRRFVFTAAVAVAMAAAVLPSDVGGPWRGSSFAPTSADGSIAAATARPRATSRSTATPKSTSKSTPTPTPTPVGKGATGPPRIGSCPVFPATNVWNKPVTGLPVRSHSARLVAAIGTTARLHPDFSNAGGYGIPFNLVRSSTPRSTVTFEYDDESDHVGYPIPARPRVEGGSDAHILMIDTSTCRLYEIYAADHSTGSWTAGSGATWNLTSNALRRAGWTSADAAGLPIFPGLVRYDEVAAGAIRHAIRFTAPSTCAGYVYPARHRAGSGSCSVKPPMGLRLRLKAGVNITRYGTQARVILQALKTYGMILADNGSPFYITGAPDARWNDDVLHALGQIKGSDFEVVDTSSFVNG